MFRYYLKHRPVGPGTVPKGFTNYYNYSYKVYVVDVGWVWAWVEYDRELSVKEVQDFELHRSLV